MLVFGEIFSSLMKGWLLCGERYLRGVYKKLIVSTFYKVLQEITTNANALEGENWRCWRSTCISWSRWLSEVPCWMEGTRDIHVPVICGLLIVISDSQCLDHELYESFHAFNWVEFSQATLDAYMGCFRGC